jgi:hypothetical protein
MGALRDLTGLVFGQLTVRSRNPINSGARKPRWDCICSCGKACTVIGGALLRGHTRSCGCLVTAVVRKRCTTHGHAPRKGHNPTYVCWGNMLARCRPGRADAEWYIDQGVTVCKRWLRYENFFADMGQRPLGKSIDRKNPWGNYSKRNCRWATPHEQRVNQRPRKYWKRP